MGEPRFPQPLPVGASLADAVRVYRLLWQRSVLVATTVYAVIALLQIGRHVSTGAAGGLLGLAAALCSLAGPQLVQGALILLVRNVHEGRPPDRARAAFAGAGDRALRLVGASFLYAFGTVFGLLLLVVPGLVVFARWALMPAVVMLEDRGVGASRTRSSALVRGQSFEVFLCLAAAFLLIAAVELVFTFGLDVGFGTRTFLSFVWASVTAPFSAHLLTVVYYRRSDPGRPVIDPAVLGWRSVWDGR